MHSLTPASQSRRLGHNCSKSCIAISTMHLWEEVPQLRHSWTDGDLQGSPCTKFLERMGSSREISYPSMANTAHGLKASIKRLFHKKKIKWYKMVQKMVQKEIRIQEVLSNHCQHCFPNLRKSDTDINQIFKGLNPIMF